MSERYFEAKSICVVTDKLANGKSMLLRLADLIDGEWIVFISDNETPKNYDNREYIFQNDGPTTIGYIGVWEWNATPNKSGADTDYVISKYLPYDKLIEVTLRSGNLDITDLIEILKSGVTSKLMSGQIAIITNTSKYTYNGIICNIKDFNYIDGKYFLRNEVNFLNVINITDQDIIYFKDFMLYNMECSPHIATQVLTRDKFEIIKEIILNRVTWPALKKQGMTKNQWREFKEFLSSLREQSLIKEVATECIITEESARIALDDFISTAFNYIDADNIEDQVLLAIIDNHPSLQEKCSNLVKLQWETDNTKRLKEANNEIASLHNMIVLKENELRAIESQIELKKQQINSTQLEIESARQLGIEVTKSLKQKLDDAVEYTADFLGNSIISQYINHIAISGNSDKSSFLSGTILEDHQLETYNSWNDLLNSLEIELVQNGVLERESMNFSAYLYAAYLLRIPLIISGPNSINIANSLSYTLFGRSVGLINCDNPLSKETLEIAASSSDKIIVINNPFKHGFNEILFDFINTCEKYIIIACPFTEDLRIEPRNTFNHFLPIFTEFFVDNLPTNQSVGGIISNEFEHYVTKTDKTMLNSIKSMYIPPFTKTKISSLISNSNNIRKDDSKDFNYLYVYLPYAYCTNQSSSLLERLELEKNIKQETKDIIFSFLGGNP